MTTDELRPAGVPLASDQDQHHRPNGPESHARPELIPRGQRLRSVREAMGLSLEQCAVAVGVSSKTWHRYEQGQRDPDSTVLARVVDVARAAGLNVESAWLLKGEGRGPAAGGWLLKGEGRGPAAGGEG